MTAILVLISHHSTAVLAVYGISFSFRYLRATTMSIMTTLMNDFNFV